MSYLLCIETSTKVCSVALFKNDELIDFEEEDGSYSHAENLAVFIDKVLKRKSVNYSDLAAVVVSKGPGSYTGLRIGVSLAKGIAYGAQIPLIAIDSLSSLAWAAIRRHKTEADFFIPMIDARRMEVYAAVYDQKLNQLKEISADIVEEDTYAAYLNEGKVCFLGDGAEKCKSTVSHQNAVFIQQKASAKNMGALAFEAFQQKRFEDVAYFEPFYLKEFVAIKSKKKLV
ncbi:MAG: tRNA (adenosine(37)-N6)-threonylcarbamoyltransferase complex dimerization subunit type 1 TsaB [Flavobacteriales bacterium]|nr:tRNA (adenosine(37)-N6)-threonylcarbamoyltransferase complex dimerization subunit type 1 TsaB [Flavobacteriales bacterium]|tara:strand:+ start:72189 stop:72875 length:687 start_codon:yes stop_codon:yes gene_type:complete